MTTPSEREESASKEVIKQPPICGATYPATVRGFQRFILDANQRHMEGYRLHSFTRVEKKLAAVYVITGAATTRVYKSFVEDGEDENPILNHSFF